VSVINKVNTHNTIDKVNKKNDILEGLLSRFLITKKPNINEIIRVDK